MSVTCLLDDQVKFEPLSGVTNIFFDDKSFQIFSVRSRGATGIIIKGFDEQLSSTFRLEDKGPIISIKLSPDQKVLSVQRSKSSVEFFNVVQLGANGNLDPNSYEQAAKSKASTILGFYWTDNNEIVYLTSHGIEIYHILPEKRQVKSVRNLNQLINWFVFCPITNLLVVATAKSTPSLYLFYIKNSNIYKLPKLDIDPINSSKVEVKEKDVQVLSLYGEQYLFVILHPSSSTATAISTGSISLNSEIHAFKINKDAAPAVQKAHVLRTTFNGSLGLAMHSIDDVVLVHNRKAGETTFFDVGLSGEFDGAVSHHVPLGKVTSIRIPQSDAQAQEYPAHWVLFAPDIVIDANAGIMWRLKLKLAKETLLSPLELPRHISFMLQRQGAKRVLLDTLVDCCHKEGLDLTSIGDCFDRINKEYRLYIDEQLAPSIGMSVSTFHREVPAVANTASRSPAKVIVDQSDIYTNILSPLLEQATSDPEKASLGFKKIMGIVIEYLRSLEERQIPAQHFLHELVINVLVRSGQFYQLHQLLQYHIIADSKPLACLLLSLEAVYPSAFQLSIDMLKRLKISNEEITEVLLSKGKVISALIYAKSCGLERQIPARKFLQAASATGDGALMHNCQNWLKDHKLLTAKDAHDYSGSFANK